MKILVISQYYYPEPFRVHEICEGLVKRGHSVTVVTTFPNYPEGNIYSGYKGEKKRIEIINNVKVIRYKTKPRGKGLLNLGLNYISYVLSTCCKLNEICKEEYDIIYVYGLSPITMAIPGILIKRKKKIPLYIYCLDLWPESIKDYFPNEKNYFFRLVKKMSSKIYQSADLIGITSQSFANYLCDVCEVQEKKIEFLPQHAADIGECIKEVDDGMVNFYFTGNIGDSQNIEVIIEAVKLIKDIPNFTVNFVGSGSKLEEYKAKVKELNLEGIIIFHGRYPSFKMVDFYKKADACLLTLSNKTQIGLTIPGKLQTYMAAGKPIIAAIDGGAVEVIRKADCGVVASANDINMFADNLREFIYNKERYMKLGQNARLYYEKYFSLDKHLEKLEEELYKLIEKRFYIITK